MPVRAGEKSNQRGDTVPHSFVHCTEGSKGLDLETTRICKGSLTPWLMGATRRFSGLGEDASSPSLEASVESVAILTCKVGGRSLCCWVCPFLCYCCLHECCFIVFELGGGGLSFPGLLSISSLPTHMHPSSVILKIPCLGSTTEAVNTLGRQRGWASREQEGTHLPGRWLGRLFLDVLTSPSVLLHCIP